MEDASVICGQQKVSQFNLLETALLSRPGNNPFSTMRVRGYRVARLDAAAPQVPEPFVAPGMSGIGVPVTPNLQSGTEAPV